MKNSLQMLLIWSSYASHMLFVILHDTIQTLKYCLFARKVTQIVATEPFVHFAHVIWRLRSFEPAVGSNANSDVRPETRSPRQTLAYRRIGALFDGSGHWMTTRVFADLGSPFERSTENILLFRCGSNGSVVPKATVSYWLAKLVNLINERRTYKWWSVKKSSFCRCWRSHWMSAHWILELNIYWALNRKKLFNAI